MSFSPIAVGISNITNSNPAVVTTSANHNMTTGQVVRLNVPKNYGMVELNHMQVFITVLSLTTFSIQASQCNPINIDSTYFTPFTIPSNPSALAQVIPIGSGASPVTGPAPLVTNSVCVSSIDDALVNISTVPIPF